jgi:hypothetical protein
MGRSGGAELPDCCATPAEEADWANIDGAKPPEDCCMETETEDPLPNGTNVGGAKAAGLLRANRGAR